MAEDKKDTLTKLYSIRAGISAVAVEREKVEEINRNTEQEIEKLNEQIYSFNAQIAKDEKEIEDLEDSIERHKKYLEEHKDNKMPKKPKPPFFSIFGLCAIVAVIIAAIIYLILSFTQPDWFNFTVSEGVDAVLELLCFFLIGGGIFGFFGLLFGPVADQIEDRQTYYDNSIRNYNHVQNEISYSNKKIEENQQRVSILKNEIAESEKAVRGLEDLIEDLKAKAEAACTPHYQLGNMIQQQFENNFTGFLNLRDWRNTDIIIFAYESGRVDNMKEALAYVDGEVRTDRIVKAINDSSKAICRSIQSGLRDLAIGMGKCFSIISEQIAQQTKYLDKISADMGKLAQNTANLSKGLSALAGKVDYSKVLK